MARLVLVDDETGADAKVSEADTPFVVRAGRALSDIPRQVGLTARYAIEGPAQAAQIVTEPIRAAMGLAGVKAAPLGESAAWLADKIGLPSPRNETERVVGDATRLMSGSAATMGAGGAMSSLPGMTGKLGQLLAANPGQQLAASVGAGLAGGASREAGADPLTQAGASLLGGIGGGIAASAGSRAVDVAKSLLPKNIDQQITVTLQRAGIDFGNLPAQTQAALRQEVGAALRTGRELNPEALSRLADFRALGITPTRGMITQDPVQITREMNLAKIGANSSDGSLGGLAGIQNRNNARLIEVMNESGAAGGDPFVAGEATLAAIRARDASMKKGVDAAYSQARELYGREVPLDRQSVIGAIWDRVNAENKGAFFPSELKQTINRISQGKEPFTVGVLDNLETMLATASRATQDGNVKRAIQLAREAILDSPLSPVKNAVGGNQAVTQDVAAALRAADETPAQVMEALRQARAAARDRFSWQESSPPVSAAIGGMEPDKFFQRFVLNGTVADAQTIAANGGGEATKAAILDFLKTRALNGATDETGKFSQAAFRKALNTIGERKLELFFSPEELQNLQRIGRVSSLMMNQPVGSAVNNSNSGATLLGRGYDALRFVADKIPFGRAAILDPLQSIDVSMRNRSALNVTPGLLGAPETTPMWERLVSPMIATGGLLAP